MTINDLTILWLLMTLLSYVQAFPRSENADRGDSQCKQFLSPVCPEPPTSMDEVGCE